ncbi:amidohydrolase [Falsochrobactrum shanghaiense]|uniref:Amidohydrolase n=1 Tax=Falsochrobactrum shanghaiense TaxID=2201899 RepID=A0A316J556_9HYPH|nr:amidohydrolase family protein [Falsochrobactrum shanghaiense]PWL16298.1 amidohydrolase [Falsochrobactrum shanghaiense]
MRTAIINIGTIVSGDLNALVAQGDCIITDNGKIVHLGAKDPSLVESADVVIDAAGTTAMPGLIDSHVHITFGDYTPRQRTVGYLESYVHGGTTTSITASEVHTPGRPTDAQGVKALAMAARACFEGYRPGGMRVHAGSVILEPDLRVEDLDELRAGGVWLAKAGFGRFATPFDYAPLMNAARAKGFVTTMHTGGSSIPGSSGIWAEHVLRSNPNVSFHVNGGPTAMPDEGFATLVNEGKDIALQLCTAGNLRTALLTAKLLDEAGMPERLLIATDTPTGSGIMPLGMFYTITHLCSLGGMSPVQAIAAATGNNARVYGLNSGVLAAGRDADIVLIDACDGGSKNDALSGISNGDVPAVAAVVTAGVPRFVGRSRNTPASIRKVKVTRSNVVELFSGAAAH